MKPVLLLCAAITVQPLIAAVHASLSGLKGGDFVQIDYRWRNVDVPPTATGKKESMVLTCVTMVRSGSSFSE